MSLGAVESGVENGDWDWDDGKGRGWKVGGGAEGRSILFFIFL